MAIRRVFITGAAGFIGSHLTRRLACEGYKVGIQKRKTTDCSRIRDIIGEVKVYDLDIRDGCAVIDAIADFKPDVIIHLVTYYAVEHRPDEVGVMMDANVRGTVNLLEAARSAEVPYFINTSTCAVYRESSELLAETDPLAPQNLYALTKLQAEEACTFYAENYGIDGVTLRLFPPYGPGDHERRLIPYVIRTLAEGKSPNLTSGRQRWDFVYVDDVVDAYIAAIAAFPFACPHEYINIGTGEAPSVREVVETIRENMSVDVELAWGSVSHRKNEVWFNSADANKAACLIGWSPKVSVKEGLARTIEWFMEHPQHER